MSRVRSVRAAQSIAWSPGCSVAPRWHAACPYLCGISGRCIFASIRVTDLRSSSVTSFCFKIDGDRVHLRY